MDTQILTDLKKEISSLLEQGRIQDALPLIRQAAHWGDLESQLLAADLYLHQAYGMPRNPYAAIEYVKLAALNNDAHSMYELADLYKRGYGTDKDEEKAFYYMKKAALNEEKAAFDEIAMMYLMGKGTAKDVQEALKWIEKAHAAFPNDPVIARHFSLIEKANQHHNG